MSQNGNGNANGNANGNQQGTPQQTPSPSSSSSTISLIPQTAPAGGIIITQPPQSATSFYKIAPSQVITFGWNMTNVLSTPAHLTVSAVCENGNTYPVGPTDGIIDGTASSVVWDIYSYQQNHPNTPLAQATYTLHIWDERGPSSPRAPGKLEPNSGLQFALYTPQPYTALSDGWSCAACNSATSIASHPAFISIFVSLLVMFLSGVHLVRHSR